MFFALFIALRNINVGGIGMNLTAHLSSLNTRKEDIENELEFEMNRPLPNFLKMTELKRKKLILKEEIARLMKNRKTA